MQRLRTALAWGLVLMLLFVAIRASAAAWKPYDVIEHVLGWAAARGGRALDLPGHHLLAVARGTGWADNNPPAAELIVVAIPMAALFAVGFVAGLIRRPSLETASEGFDQRAPDTVTAEARVGKSLALIALALALVGTAGYGFVAGFAAVVVALRARRHLPKGTRGRCASSLAILIGTLEAVAWLAILVTSWHPFPDDSFSL